MLKTLIKPTLERAPPLFPPTFPSYRSPVKMKKLFSSAAMMTGVVQFKSVVLQSSVLVQYTSI
jgi:hypothetical protein